jgi:hypothetical protein
LKNFSCIFFSCFLVFPTWFVSQTTVFKEGLKWGIKENEKIIINPQYDTVFNFDASGKTCIACYKNMSASSNKFIKTLSKTYTCNYLNKNLTHLSVKTDLNDTCSTFILGKHTIKQFTENETFFVVSVKNKKYLVDRNFNQYTFKGYHEIVFCTEPTYLITKITPDGNSIYSGLINLKEELIVPHQYTDITLNTKDSLIVACSAGLKATTEDDVFDYSGKKIGTYNRHVELATKNFVIHKLFEPTERYMIYNVTTKDEKEFYATEAELFSQNELLIRIKSSWFLYNMANGEKTPYKKS